MSLGLTQHCPALFPPRRAGEAGGDEGEERPKKRQRKGKGPAKEKKPAAPKTKVGCMLMGSVGVWMMGAGWSVGGVGAAAGGPSRLNN